MEKEEMTIDKIKALNNSITVLCKQFVVNNRTDLVDDVREMMPFIQKFAMWFIETGDIGVSPEEKDYMNSQVLEMLKDINDALANEDSVLMYDALESGVAEYLRLFIPEEELNNE